MKKYAFLCLIIFVVLTTLASAVNFAFAEPDEDIILITADMLLPSDYYEFEDLSRIAVSASGTIAALDATAEGLLLKIIGETGRTRALINGVNKIAIYNNYVIGNFGGSNLSTYSISEDVFNITPLNSEFSDIAIDESENLLYTLTRTNLTWYTLAEGATLNIAESGRFDFVGSTPMFDKIAVRQGLVYMYYSNGTKVHSFNKANGQIQEVFTGLISNDDINTLFYPSADGFLLVKSDGIYHNTYLEKVINLNETSASDNQLKSIKTIAVDGNKIFVVDNAYNAIKTYDISSYEFAGYYGSYGEGLSRLNSPSKVFAYDDAFYVADTGNNRVLAYSYEGEDLIIEPLTGTVPTNPKIVAAIDGFAYISKGDNHLFFYNDKVYENTYSFVENIRGVAITNTGYVYVASGNKVFRKAASDTNFEEYIVLNSAVDKIATGIFGKILYLISDNTVSGYYSNDIKTNASIALADYGLTATDIVDMDADYCGNLYIATIHMIYRFERKADCYELSGKYSVSNAADIGGMSIAPDGVVYITSAHYLLTSVELDVVTQAQNQFNNPTVIEFPIKIVAGSGWIQASPNNYEEMLFIKEEEYLMVFNSTVTFQQVEYYFVEYQGKEMYIPVESCETVYGEVADNQYVKCLFDTVNIYQYPSATSAAIFSGLTRENIIEVDARVAVVNGEDVWGWYQVIYEGRLGYVQVSSVVGAENPMQIVERYYVKAKSGHFGAAIRIYTDRDVSAQVLATISDGATVELTSPLDRSSVFSEVRINNTIGYILTENLMERGLTNGQILALVLSFITVAASVVLVLLFRIFKKRV
ncbi:MAG: hypothetical protein EOM87_01595 [Clostridia bacterium]|nr:hypothetical protein [Clostridia bacterium]